jgi:mannosyltransferase OCH1-like enzyme
MIVLVACTLACAGLRRHIVAKNPTQPSDGIMVPSELWDDARCRKIVGPMFDEIEHGPYKADLCRLYVLYRHGGVYTDDDVYLLKAPALRNLTVVRESLVFKESPSQVGLFNAYIEVPHRYSPSILRAIKLSAQQIHRAHTFSLALWGPTILDKALKHADRVELQEQCTHTPCDCHVPGVLLSHKPCRY